MRLFSQFPLQTARTLAFLLLALTLARPVSSQTASPVDTIQVIAQQQKLISQTYKLERIGEEVMYRETLALLAACGAWTTTVPPNEEIIHLIEAVNHPKQDLIYAKREVEKNRSVSEDELKRFSDMYTNVEALLSVAIDVHDLLKNGEIDEATALYRTKSLDLMQAINRDSYTLVSGLEGKIDKAALHARLAK